MASALLAPWWGARPARRGGHPRLAVAAGFAPLLLGLLVLAWIPVTQATSQGGLIGLLAAMVAYAAQALAFLYWRPRERQTQTRRQALWLAFSFATQLAFGAIAARILAAQFAARYAPFDIASPLSVTQLQILSLLAMMTGGMALAAAVAGAVGAMQSDDVLIHDEVDSSGFAERDLEWIGRMKIIAEWLMAALLLRAGAVAFSIALGALSSPISPGHYFQISLAPSSSLLIARLLIGLALPMAYCGLALRTLNGESPREAGQQFAPALMMMVLTEIFAAALTVGNWGVAF